MAISKDGKYHCYLCGERKFKEEFERNNNRNAGISSRCKKCSNKKDRPQHKEYIRNYVKNYQLDARNKVKLLARKLMTKAIKDGILIRKPCEVCGNKKSEGHHDDYSKPLEVRWMCDSHHQQYHAKNK